MAQSLHRSRLSMLSLGWYTLRLPNDTRTFAAVYARLGLSPMVLHGLEDGRCTCGRPDCERSAGKHPLRAGWQQERVSPAAVDQQLAENWQYNLGLRMGLQPSGMRLVCLDLDGPASLLAAEERVHGALPPTLTARTGSGGLHLVYRLPDGAEMPPNRTRVAPGIDVRSEGGQIVAAPSRHRSGRRYEWIDAREPAVLP